MQSEPILSIDVITDDETGLWSRDICDMTIVTDRVDNILRVYGEKGFKEIMELLDVIKNSVTDMWEELNELNTSSKLEYLSKNEEHVKTFLRSLGAVEVDSIGKYGFSHSERTNSYITCWNQRTKKLDEPERLVEIYWHNEKCNQSGGSDGHTNGIDMPEMRLMTLREFYEILDEVVEKVKKIEKDATPPFLEEYNIIDVDPRGNVIRFYLGKNGSQYGDDWNDAPYEHNAGRVYLEFVVGYVDVAFPFESHIVYPEEGTYPHESGAEYTKNDMRDRKIHAVEVNSHKIYFGDYINDDFRNKTSGFILRVIKKIENNRV